MLFWLNDDTFLPLVAAPRVPVVDALPLVAAPRDIALPRKGTEAPLRVKPPAAAAPRPCERPAPRPRTAPAVLLKAEMVLVPRKLPLLKFGVPRYFVVVVGCVTLLSPSIRRFCDVFEANDLMADKVLSSP